MFFKRIEANIADESIKKEDYMRKILASLIMAVCVSLAPLSLFAQERILVDAVDANTVVGQGTVDKGDIPYCIANVSRMTTFQHVEAYPQYLGLSTASFHLGQYDETCFYYYQVMQENLAGVVITDRSSQSCTYNDQAEPWPLMTCSGYLPFSQNGKLVESVSLQLVTKDYNYRPIELASDWTNDGSIFDWLMFGWGTLIPAIFR